MLLNNILFWICLFLSILTALKMTFHKWKVPFSARQKAGNRKNISDYSGRSDVTAVFYRLLLVLTVLTAVLVRLYRFGLVPGGFNQDGAMAAIDAKALADYGTDHYGMRFPVHLTAWGYGQMSSLLSYLMIPFTKLFGLCPAAVRMPQLLVSLLGLCCLYLFARNVFGKTASLILLMLAAVNPWHILQSRWTVDCNLYPHFFLMGIYFLERMLHGAGRKCCLCLSMVLFGLTMYCYGISIYTTPVFLTAACIYLLAAKKISFPEMLLALFVYLLTAWPFIGVMAINYFKLPTIETPFFTMPYFPGSIRSGDILFFSENPGKQLMSNLKSLLNVALLQAKDLPWNTLDDFGTMYLFSLPFAFTGLFGLLREFRRKPGAMFLLFYLGTGIWCGLVTNNVNVNRLNIIFYPILILIALGIYETVRRFSLPAAGCCLAAYLSVFILFLRTYFTDYALTMDYYFFKDFGSALSSIKDCDAEKFYITADSQSTGSYWVSETLTLFWHEIDAAYFQGQKTPQGQLPYGEKYTFQSIKDIVPDPSENAAYLITAQDLVYFDLSLYEFRQFGSYYTVVKKQQ